MQMNVGLAVGEALLAKLQGDTRVIAALLLGRAAYVKAWNPQNLWSVVALSSNMGVDAATPGRGSVDSPYKTWKALMTALGEPSTKEKFEATRVIIVQGGTHDVTTAKLPMGRWAIVLAQGAKLTGALTWELNSDKAHASTLPPSVAIFGEAGAYQQSDIPQLVVEQKAGVAAVTECRVDYYNVTLQQITIPATVTTQNVRLEDVAVSAKLGNAAMDVVAVNSTFADDITCKTVKTQGGEVNANVTAAGICEFHGTKLAEAKTFTGIAGAFRVDFYSNFWAKAGAGWTLAGGATKILVGDAVA